MTRDAGSTTSLHPLSSGQQAIWYLCQVDPLNSAYNVNLPIRIHSPVDADALRRSFQCIVDRHAPLRTTFGSADGRPVQRVQRSHPVHFESVAGEEWDEPTLDRELRRIASRPFDIERGPVFRVTLIRRGHAEHVLVVAMHHLVTDMWSTLVLMEELSLLYPAECSGTGVVLPRLPLEYTDFVARQRRNLDGADGERLWAYWREALAGDLPPLELQTDRPRPSNQTLAGETHRFRVDADLTSRLRALARAERVTFFTLLLSAFQVLLHRYSGQPAIVVGSPVAARSDPDLEPLIGYFVNPLVFRGDFSADPELRELLRSNARAVLGALEHQDFPFPLLVDRLNPQRDPRRSPVFQAMFSLERPHRSDRREAPAFLFGEEGKRRTVGGLEMEPFVIDAKGAQFELTLAIHETDQVLQASFEYNTDLFDRATIAGMELHFRALLEAILETPSARVSALSMTTPAERRLVEVDFSGIGIPAEPPGTVVKRIWQAASRTPDAIAIDSPGGSLTYRELKGTARDIATGLRARGCRPGSVVGILAGRSREAIAAMLGVLEAGATYLALDPAYPPRRLALLIEDASPGLLLVQEGREALLRGLSVPESVPIHAVAIPSEPGTERWAADPGGAAYVAYTSGSTGRPKGARIAHHGLLNHAVQIARLFRLQPGDRVLQFASLGFDVAAEEIYPSLVSGASVILRPEGELPAIRDFARTLAEWEITVVNLPATYWHQWAAELEQDHELLPPGVRLVIVGSERVRPDCLARWKRVAGSRVRLLNGYGPTEATITATIYEVPDPASNPRDQANVSIGRPLPGVHVHVLDSAGRSLPVGVPGEVHIGGVGVALDYLGGGDLEARRFLPDPFAGGNGARLYRTGDLARWRPDGNLEFLGRLDDQIKVRGFRVEPGEIETVLRAHPQILDAAVVAEEFRGDRRFIAYFVPSAGAGTDVDAGARPGRPADAVAELRSFLAERLPEYMIPAAFVRLDSIPRTPGGKVARAALPASSEVAGDHEREPVLPRTTMEERLAAIWASTLGVTRVGVFDNFFSLGGDSILSIQVVAAARRAGIRITTRQFLEHPTIAALAVAALESGSAIAEQGPVSGDVPLTPIQAWLLDQGSPDPHHDNQSVVLVLRESPDAIALEEALRAVLRHHDALRHRFVRGSSGWTQHVDALVESVPLTRVRAGSPDAFEATCAEAQSSLDLERGPVFRAILFECEGHPARLLLIAHHLVIDGVSWRILLDDLATAYERARGGSEIALPPKTTSFQAWARRLTEYARGEAVSAERGFWTDPRRRTTRPLPADVDSEGGERDQECWTRTHSTRFSEEDTEALLNRAARVDEARIDDLLLAALSRALSTWGGAGSWLVDLEGHGREEIFEDVDLSRTVGWFTTLFPVLLEGGAVADRRESLDAVRRELRSITRHGIGFGLLRWIHGAVGAPPEWQALPTSEICFNYLGRLDGVLPAGGPFQFAGEPLHYTRSPRAPRSHLLEVNALVTGGRLEVIWSYSGRRFQETTIAQLAARYGEELRALTTEAGAPVGWHPRPVGLPADSDATALEGLPRMDAERVEDVYPLSPLQEGMLFHSLEQGDPSAYVEQLSWMIEGSLDENTLRSSWRQLAARHPVLRTGFAWDGLDRPLQFVRSEVEIPWESLDYRAIEEGERTRRLEEYLRAERGRPFDLARAPLMRLALLRTGDQTHQFVLTHHHLILDGWSVPLLLEELATLLEAARNGGEATLQNPPLPYRDYIAWLRMRDGREAEGYWRERLKGFRAATSLRLEPPDPDRPVTSPESALDDVRAEQRRELSAETTRALDRFARRNALTPATLVQAAWAVLLSRYSGEEDVLFGSVASGRPPELEGIERTLGVFINTLPMRIRVPERERVLPWLREVQERQFEALRFEQTSLVDARRWSDVPPGKPLFETIVVFENYPLDKHVFGKLGGVGMRDLRSWDKTNYPISLAAAPGPRLTLQIVYDRRLLGEDQVARMADHLVNLLESLPRDPDALVRDLPLFSEAQRGEIVSSWNEPAPGSDRDRSQGRTRYPERCIHELIEEVAARQPHAVAVVHPSRSLTYGALLGASGIVASRLRSMGIDDEAPVAVCMERSPEAIIAMLGVLQAGGAYVPIDPAYPADRIAFMLEDLGAPVLLTQRRLRDRIPPRDAPTITIEEIEASPPAPADRDGPPPGGPDRLAYIMYTSGSTGRPKGVEVTHRGIVRLVRNTDWVRYAEDDVVLQVVSLSFDPSALEIWGCLLNGGRLVLHPSRTPSLDEIGEMLLEHGVTSVILVTGLFPLMVEERLEDLRGLRQLIVGGDAMPAAAARRVLEAIPGLRLINAYGPTEGTVVACAHTMADSRSIGATVPIGRPIPHARVYLLDRELRPVPWGVPGEIFIGGDGVARGYHGRPDITAERFLPDPFVPPGSAMYRTGDLARHRPDGTLEFLGRVDEQVKVRGFRVEPGEVEAVLGQHPSVRLCAVSTPRTATGDRKLVAYVAGDAISSADLRAFLRSKLPEFMVPSAFVIVDRLPLTANGKVDRGALASLEPGDEPVAVSVPPATPTERAVADIWGELLACAIVGVHDDFFQSGGDSLVATRLVSRLRSRFGPIVTLRDLFDGPTIQALARRIDAVSRPTAGPAEPSAAAEAGSLAPDAAETTSRLEERS